ncbi:MAG: hypothetical protein AB8G23_17325 [Myxococcota bacterium]
MAVDEETQDWGRRKAMLKATLVQEVDAVHAYISAWFRGDVPQSDADFIREFAGRLAPGMVNIQPSGQILTGEQLVTGIRAGYGSNPDFRIAIREGELRGFDDQGGLAMFTYAEFQTGARQTVPADNVRVSSVLFSVSAEAERPFWLHIHETARANEAGR